ncbi:S-adenosyl-L-methionine-dependent methyltransferase [Pluteus cervinus]|uniref:S-adenosyl-L-methionine-dependent methyltransferase n=1 Tax=Pluteus cervinus TaxID=181527 RepID=A0ACD3BHK1_9AGAR|nr:S-adenosyl-L-methionine-dependent methyltransferase [Pluteus cervinus]
MFMKPLTSPPPPTPNASSIFSNNSDGKRQPRHKEGQFIFKHGQRHHAFDNEKAPYPLSYDRQVLELESLDNRLVRHLRGSVSFVNFRDGPPQRVLDLGCGTGTWVIDAAEEWPECEFVGFDLVNIQIPLKLLDSSISRRIEWRHGNFLTTKLPFDDDEFDHVHIQSIAKGVPENKWGILFEEINRVLTPEGSVEILEDDVAFPLLPRWFTTALRARPRRASSIHFPDGTHRGYPSRPNTPSRNNKPLHDHALLESLNRSVFEHRFINMKPTAVLPSYFTTYFRQVTLGPVVHFPMPPVPPLQPLPPQIITTYVIEPNSDTLDARASTIFPPTSPSSTPRPISLSFSSSIAPSVSTTSTRDSVTPSLFSGTRTASTSFSSNEPFELSSDRRLSTPCISPNKELPPPPFERYTLDSSLNEAGVPKQSLIPVESLDELSERSLAMHLYRSYQSVLACQEAMWEELKDRIRNRKDELLPFGWDDDEELEELQSRKKFERLIDRYRTDMHTRIGLWCSLTGIGWPFPPREPLSKAELIEEERMRECLLEARKYATADDYTTPCRSLRVLVGYKV